MLDADWVRSTFEQIISNEGEVLYEFPFTIPDGRRNTAWDGDDGFVALTESGLIWMRPEGRRTIDVPQGSIVDIAVTEAGTHVIGLEALEDGSVFWIELETVAEVEEPSGASTTDGETFSVADRSVTIEDPDWSDVEHDEAGGPIPPFDLPELVVSEDGREVLRLPVGSEARPYVDIHDFDGRRLVIAAQPQEPASSAEHRLDHRSGVRRVHPGSRDAWTRILRSDRGPATGGRNGAASLAMNDLHRLFRVGHPAAITGPSTYLDPHLMLPVRSIP